MGYRPPNRGFDDLDLINFYKWVDIHNYTNAIKLLKQRNVFVLTEGGRYFTGSVQEKGIYIFTDIMRAADFLNQERNATAQTVFEVVPFLPTWYRATCDLYVNLTPYKCNDPFLVWRHDNDWWTIGTKADELKWTLPYGLTPKREKKKSWWLR